MKFKSVSIWMKATEQYFTAILFIRIGSVDVNRITLFIHGISISYITFSVYYAVQGGYG